MRKGIVIFVIILLIIFSFILYTNDMQMNECLEFRVSKLTKREITQLQDSDLFNGEEVIKIYLSENQTKNVKDKIEKNNNWKKGKIDERLEEKIKFYTRENIYDRIPNIENVYWIFTNRSNAEDNKHSVDELLEDGMYYAISLGILDVDNNILYYYEYDR